jgi:hypothetical protein
LLIGDWAANWSVSSSIFPSMVALEVCVCFVVLLLQAHAAQSYFPSAFFALEAKPWKFVLPP